MAATAFTWTSLELLFFNAQIANFIYMFWDIRAKWKENWRWIYIGWLSTFALLCLIFAIVQMTADTGYTGYQKYAINHMGLVMETNDNGRINSGILGVAFAAIGLATWSVALLPNQTRMTKNICHYSTQTLFVLAFILELAYATMQDNYGGVAAMVSFLGFVVTAASFFLFEMEIVKKVEVHYGLFGAAAVLGLVTLIFAAIGAGKNGPGGPGKWNAVFILISISWVFTACVQVALAFCILWFHVLRQELVTGKVGYYSWWGGCAFVGIAKLMCFIAFCMSFYGH